MNADSIEAARKKRARLHGAMCDLEVSVSAPAQLATWIGDLSKRLASVHDALVDHIAEVEGPDGIIARIVRDAPRLAADADILLGDHPPLRRQAEAVVDQVESAGPHPDAATVRAVREAVLEFLGQLIRHRHLGADLVYEAYNFDIGGQA